MKKSTLLSFLVFLLTLFLVILPLSQYFNESDIVERDQIQTFYIPKNDNWAQSNLAKGFDETTFEKQKVLDFGFRSDTVVVGLDLSPFLGNRGADEILEITSPSFRSAILYLVNSKGELVYLTDQGIGTSEPKFFNNPNPTFFITSSEEWLPYVVLKLTSSERIRFNAVLSPEGDFQSSFNKRSVFINIYIGIMLALFFYNLFLYFSVLDKLYLSYSLYILFIALAQLSLSGQSYFYFLYQNADLYELSIVVFSSLGGALGVMFVRSFLNTSERVGFLDKILVLVMCSYLLTVVIRLLGAVELSYIMTDINGLLGVIFIFLTAIIIARRKVRSAYFFLIGWSFFLIGVVLFILQNQGQVTMVFFPNLPILIGTALEAILISLALADKINILKKEKEKEQSERLLALAENEKLVREQNFMLEEKVKLRTDELEQALRNLQNTQSQLVNQEKMASLGQLTAGVAHEINNPINFVSSNIAPLKRDIKDILEIIDFYRIKGASEFSPQTIQDAKQLEEDLELDYLLEEVEQLLKGMDDGARRTVEIVRGLRLFSRVDEQDVKKVNLHDGIDSTLILLKSSIPPKIEVIRDFGELPLIECLAGKINQVFMNIINNSVHVLSENLNSISDPKIIIRTRAYSEHITIEIEDNGPGMPDSVKQRLFEPFFTTKEVGKGTGLGLSIVYSIIENHKGLMEVTTEEGQGTTFKITLPIYQSTSNYES